MADRVVVTKPSAPERRGELEHSTVLHHGSLDWQGVVLPFLAAGFAGSERVAVVAGTAAAPAIRAELQLGGLDPDAVLLLDAAEHFLEGGRFGAGRALQRWRALVEDARLRGCSGVRAFVDLAGVPSVAREPEALVAYEERVHEELASLPLRLICAHNVDELPEAFQAALLACHHESVELLGAARAGSLAADYPCLRGGPTEATTRYGDLEVSYAGTTAGARFAIRVAAPERRRLPALPGAAREALLHALLRDLQVRQELAERDAQLADQQESLTALHRKLAEQDAAHARARQELELAHAKEAAIIAASADAIMLVDGNHRVVAINPALERLTGYSAGELVGQTCTYRLGACQADGSSVCDTVCPFHRPGMAGDQQVDARVTTKDGREIWVSIAYGPILDSDGRIQHVVHTIRDIHARKQLELAKDQFFSIVNHEIKNPLTSAKGYVQLLIQQATRRPQQAGNLPQLRAIDRQLSRIGELVDRLLDVSRAQLGRLKIDPQPLDLAELLRQLVEQMQVTTQRHAIVAQIAGPLPGRWDRGRLEEVFGNLIGNAIRYSPAGGKVVVGAKREDNRVVVWVQDEGIGISPEAQRRLFQPYYRSGEAQRLASEGLGLGLYVSYQIVAAHGGSIRVESAPGRGSTFTVSLPLAAPLAADPAG